VKTRTELSCYIKVNILINPLNAELNPIRHLLALVGARHIVHVSRIWFNLTSAPQTSGFRLKRLTRYPEFFHSILSFIRLRYLGSRVSKAYDMIISFQVLKFTLEHALKAQGRNTGIFQLFL
jgi:hypothetical protein